MGSQNFNGNGPIQPNITGAIYLSHFRLLPAEIGSHTARVSCQR